jgi:hypothetical protein
VIGSRAAGWETPAEHSACKTVAVTQGKVEY